jgi:hypothetical protein
MGKKKKVYEVPSMNGDLDKVLSLDFEPPAVRPERSFAEAVSEVERVVTDHVFSSMHVRHFIGELPKGVGTACPDSPVDELVRYAAIRRSDMDQSDPWVNLGFMHDVVAPVMRMQRGVMLNLTDHPGAPLFLSNALIIANIVDRLWMEWFSAVAAPYQSLNEEDKEGYKRKAKEALPEFDYTVFEYEDGEFVNRRTWAQAFPHLIEKLIRELALMAALSDGPSRAYLVALSNAYSCTDIDQLEERWAAVDSAWIEIPASCQVFAVHGMENGYEHPRCISPEFRLVVRQTDREARVIIDEYREATLRVTEKTGLPSEYVNAVSQKLTRIDVGVFGSVAEAGVCLNFRYAGQVVPNRQEILEEGGKIFMSISSIEHGVALIRGKVEAHCALETAKLVNSYVKTNAGLEHTVFHEFFHPVGCTREVTADLGSHKDLLEEAKASLGGMVVGWSIDESRGKQLEIASLALGRAIRFFDKNTLNNETVSAYVRENLVVMSLMLRSGLVRLEENGLVMDPTPGNLRRWKSSVWWFISEEVLPAYRRRYTKNLEMLTEMYCGWEKGGVPEIHNEIKKIIDWINR